TLNFSKQNQYQFVVKVTDCAIDENNPKQSDIAKVTINITDINNAPKFITVSDVYDVDENEDEGTVVNGDKILVYDDDQDDVDKLTITIRDNYATAALDAAKLFEVVRIGNTNSQTHESTFVIKTKAGLDYEALYKSIDKDAIFNVTLTITDTEGNTTSKDCQIRVIDVNEEPIFKEESFKFNVKENCLNAISVGKIIVKDPDVFNTEYGTLYYSLDGDEATKFTILSGGEIYTIYGTKLDYETKNTYEFTAVVTDKKHTISVPVTVNIDNVVEAPVFAEKNPVLLVDEYAEIGSKVGTVSANDDDIKNGKTGKRPTYSLEATDYVADDYKAFEIDKSSGVIKVKAHPIESFNTKHEYNVRVVATDGDDPSLTDYVDVVIKARLKMENLFSTGNTFTSYVAPDNMAVPEGLSAYVVTDIDGASAAIQQIDYLPQSVPVLIKRADKDVNLFMATTGNGTSFYVNKLQINETDREVSVGELYLLYRDEFVLTSSGTLPAGSVYLPINDVVAKTRSLTIGDGEDGTTGIDDITPALSEGEETWYDLQGRRQGSKPTRRGIYISNGRKVVIK
ncbi:MAG: cadherin repeat domain-containing protein, partial [Prevotella sp.]|nr:cadherin repeat domain-containing protein [Prevotella sp.]